jgi:hypothetical protein
VERGAVRIDVRLADFVQRPISADDGEQGAAFLDRAACERGRMRRACRLEDFVRDAELVQAAPKRGQLTSRVAGSRSRIDDDRNAHAVQTEYLVTLTRRCCVGFADGDGDGVCTTAGDATRAMLAPFRTPKKNLRISKRCWSIGQSSKKLCFHKV